MGRRASSTWPGLQPARIGRLEGALGFVLRSISSSGWFWLRLGERAEEILKLNGTTQLDEATVCTIAV